VQSSSEQGSKEPHLETTCFNGVVGIEGKGKGNLL